MDRALLTFFNQTLANPLLDRLMLAATFGGLALFPIIGILLWLQQRRQIAAAIFILTCDVLGMMGFWKISELWRMNRRVSISK
ncbi:MAG: hypothetical protein ALAOOOJD_02102 [bacterium]|nr:hypothetical protein [bacterium]